MGQLEKDLAAHQIIAVDTAPFIYVWERHPRYLRVSEIVFQRLRDPHVQGVTSIITLIEACVQPRRQGRDDLVRAYEQSLLHSKLIRMLPIGVEVARQAVALRSRYGLHVPDAL